MRVDPTDLDSYQARFDALERLTASSPDYALIEARHLTETLLMELPQSLELVKLERELADATDLDLSALRDAAARIAAINPLPVVISEQRTLDPKVLLEEFETTVSALERAQSTMHRTEIWLRLEMIADRQLMDLLICCAMIGAAPQGLVEIGERKLAHLSDLTLTEQWARVQREFDESRLMPSFDPASPLLPRNFLSLEPGESLRNKLSQYAMQLKPQLVAARFALKIFTYPLGALGPARMLALNGTVVPLESDGARLDLVHTLAGLAAVWTLVFRKSVAEFARLVGLEPTSRMIQGTETQDAAKAMGDLSPASRVAIALYHLRALLLILVRLEGAVSPIAVAANRHKLGLEVCLPETRAELRDASELALQKRFCRYLLDSGIYAEGTKFGPFESDLVANVRAMATVVELKLYPDDKAPTEASLRANLAQLQDYMDKRPVRPRGLLLVYNLSPLLVVGPNRWLRGRYWITCVNLGNATGSTRRDTLVLEEDTGPELLRSFRVAGAQGPRTGKPPAAGNRGPRK